MTTQSRSFTPALFDSARTTPNPVTWAGGLIAQAFRRARHLLRIWDMRRADRAFLAGLKGYQLSEMGMTFDQRDREASKWLWEA